jgi:hypothetical protein
MQTPQVRSAKRPSAHRLLLAFVFALFVMIPAVLIGIRYHNATIFWDAHVYASAIHAFANGGDPYALSSYFNFVYPPIFLKTAALLSPIFPLHSGWYIYLTLNSAAVLAIPIILSRFYLRSSWLTPALAVGLFLFSPLLTAEIALLSGNISSLLYAVVLAAGIPGIRRNRWLLFYLAVICASLIKLPFLALLLLPLFLGNRQTVFSIVAAAVVLLEMFFERLLLPAQYKAFLQSVVAQVVIRRDAGFGLFPHLLRVARYLPVPPVKFAIFAHITITLAVVLCFWLLRKKREAALCEGVWVATILIVAVLANPRLLTYDADIAILPATLIAVESIRSLARRKTNPLIIALPIIIFAVLLSRNPQTAILFFILCAPLSVLAGIPTRQDTPNEHLQNKKPARIS